MVRFTFYPFVFSPPRKLLLEIQTQTGLCFQPHTEVYPMKYLLTLTLLIIGCSPVTDISHQPVFPADVQARMQQQRQRYQEWLNEYNAHIKPQEDASRGKWTPPNPDADMHLKGSSKQPVRHIDTFRL
jgi:hypothetical protein